MRSLIEMMSEEARQNELGVTAVLDRLADRCSCMSFAMSCTWNQALSAVGCIVGRALASRHLVFLDNPADVWTVERMAKLACQSRSTFTERFTQISR